MSVIRAHVEDQVLRIIEAPIIASGGQNEVKVAFTFCEKWDGFAKTATFYRDESNPYSVILDNEDICVVPWEVYYEAGTFHIGVFGNKGEIRRTSSVVKYKVKRGAITDTMPSAPTPEVYEQIMSAIAEAKTEQEHFIESIEGATDASIEAANQAATNANRVAQELTEARANGEFNGDKGDKGDTGATGPQGPKGEKGDPGTGASSWNDLTDKPDIPTEEHINSLIDAKLGVIENGTY